MIGAIQFMDKWRSICDAHIHCADCPLIDGCNGAMSCMKSSNILTLLSIVMSSDINIKEMKGGEMNEETGDYQS